MTAKRRRSDDGHERTTVKRCILAKRGDLAAPSITTFVSSNQLLAEKSTNHAPNGQLAQHDYGIVPQGLAVAPAQALPCPPSFAYFPRLPSELRALVWREAYLDHLKSQRCVCVYQGGTVPVGEEADGGNLLGARVASHGLRFDYAPPLVHPESMLLETVCREARSACTTERGVDHGSEEDGSPQSPGIGTVATSFRLPSRVFDPVQDTLYIDRQKRHGDGSTIIFYLGDRTQWVKHVRHIAIPFSLALDVARQPGLLRHLTSLEVISLVFPAGSGPQKLDCQVMLWSSATIPSPTASRRIRLRTLSSPESASILVKDDPRRPPSTLAGRTWAREGETIRVFIEQIKTSIGNRIRRTDVYSTELQKFYWSEVGTFKFEMRGCVFE